MPGINSINEKINEPLSKSYGQLLFDKLEKGLSFTTRPTHGGKLYPSSLGNSCDRYLWLNFYGKLPGSKKPAKLARIFDHGNATEDRYHKYFNCVDGVTVAQRELVIKGVLGKGQYPVSGRADFVLYIDGEPVIIEMKTIKKDDFDRLTAPKSDHATQLQIYLNLNLNNIKDGIVVYECKDNQEIKMYDLKASKSFIKSLAARVDRVLSLKKPPKLEEVEAVHEYYCDCRMVKDSDVF